MERNMNVLLTIKNQVEKEAEKKPARKRGGASSTEVLKERQVWGSCSFRSPSLPSHGFYIRVLAGVCPFTCCGGIEQVHQVAHQFYFKHFCSVQVLFFFLLKMDVVVELFLIYNTN